jgi:N6-adenosine-specific RNA methylase IME4
MTAPPPIGPFRVILADPPWKFANWSQAGEGRNPTRHYSCMTLAELKAFPREIGLDFICAPDCALLMWSTFPMLPQSMELLAAWGFKYKSGGAWTKLTKDGRPHFGTGYIYRSAAELWLLGTRGKPKTRSASVRNAILAERRENSRKPDQMHADIERLYAGPYLELFAREDRPGWTVWGNETGKFSAMGAAA